MFVRWQRRPSTTWVCSGNGDQYQEFQVPATQYVAVLVESRRQGQRVRQLLICYLGCIKVGVARPAGGVLDRFAERAMKRVARLKLPPAQVRTIRKSLDAGIRRLASGGSRIPPRGPARPAVFPSPAAPGRLPSSPGVRAGRDSGSRVEACGGAS